MNKKKFWTEERQNILINLWKNGQSARSIAEKLGRGITRNAVIGKANRLGLSQQNKKIEQLTSDYLITPGTKQCQWPFGDPGDVDFYFCSKPIQSDYPYCPEHCFVAYRSLCEKDEETN